VKYQFETPLEEHVFGKIYLGSYRQKQGKKKITFHIAYLSYQPISTADLAHKGWIGCASWLVAQRKMWEINIFSSTAFAYKSRPELFFSRYMFFESHFKLIFYSVKKKPHLLMLHTHY